MLSYLISHDVSYSSYYLSNPPGCAGMGASKEKVMENIAKAMQLHI
jgi:predicted RNase H-like HicB family nuclease